MKLDMSLSEVKDIYNILHERPDRLFELLRIAINKDVGDYLSALMKVELTDHLGREPYERIAGEKNHRNGSYERHFTLKGIGEVKVNVPRDRAGDFSTKVLPRSKQYEDCIREDLSLMFLSGINTRTLSMISKKLIGRRISPQGVSSANNQLIEAVEAWRNRDLSGDHIKYLFIDGVNFKMRVGDSIELVNVLVVIGVNDTGHKLVLGFQAGDKEKAGNWREFFKDLKRRGLKGENITLGIMDGLVGLEKVFKEEFLKAKVQRCQVHVAKNVLAKVTVKKEIEKVADDVRSVFYASTKDKAMEFFNEFKKKWSKKFPSATKCFENSIESCLTFFNYPQEEWSALRTTNIIERVNKEYRRRTKTMEIVAGEKACYTLLAFISFKMELHWRTNPIGKVRKNLPFYENYNINNFTQKN
jgi:putative transposase